MTYSIVARDPKTHEIGVAVQSHFFGVGRLTPWVETGVGAVATQSFVEVSYGPDALDRMRAGTTPADALHELLKADPGAVGRQVAVLAADGRLAVHTGKQCVGYAEHTISDGVAAQANMMENPGVPEQMLAAFHTTDGRLSHRLLAALCAAEAAGGDIRGQQSAALVIVGDDPETEKPWQRRVDIRIDDHAEPLHEMRRLVDLENFYRQLEAILTTPGLLTGEMNADEKSVTHALDVLASGEQLLKNNQEARFWRAILLARTRQMTAATTLLREATTHQPQLKEFARRLTTCGVSTDAAAVEELLSLI